MKFSPKFGVPALGALALAVASASVSAAEGPVEEVVVTGSYIKRLTQEDSISPITNLGRGEIDNTGILTNQELIRWLPSNTGSENQADALTQGTTPGTANINLRGLGLGSTLVLVNGRRQTVSSATANGGDTFVDLNALMPMIMLENVEILKDGAAAIYGSDAVAGVANYKTRDSFRAFEVRGDWQGTSQGDDHEDRSVQAIFGTDNGAGTSLVAGFSYFKRDGLFLADRDFPRRTVSSFGQPGSYLLLGAPTTGVPGTPGQFNPDPDCLTATGASISPDGQLCQFDFGPSYSLVPDETRTQFYAVAEHSVSDFFNLRGEFGYAKNDIEGGYSPSFPFLAFPIVGANHPGNPWGTPVAARTRVFGDGLGAPGSGRVINNAEHETTRYVLAADGILGVGNWGYDLSFTRSRNDFFINVEDQSLSRVNLALQGLAGTNCDPVNGTPGQGDCLYFNPFANALTAQPGDPQFNTQEVLDFVTARNPSNTESRLDVIDFVLSGDVMDLPAGPMGLAVGYQSREESRVADLSDTANAEDLAFLIGDPDTAADRDVEAFFAETLVPLYSGDESSLEAQLAVRYEDYSSGFDSTDPKIGLLYRRGANFSARATWGTSFRAPTLFQQNVRDTSLNATLDPLTSASPVFIGWTATPNANLQPEEAETINVGFTVSPLEDLVVSLDYYRTEYENRLVQESGQQLILRENAALAAAGCTVADITTAQDANCLALRNPQIVRDPSVGTPLRVNVNRFNAAKLETDGVDLEVRYDYYSDLGSFSVLHNSSYVNSFELDTGDGSPVIEGAGRRNNQNPLANPVPQLRSNTVFGWMQGNLSANFVARYIDDYEEDNGAPIDDWWVFDLNATYNLPVGDAGDAQLTVGALNLFDEDPPEATGNVNDFGYDTKTHDPRGRMLFMRVQYGL